MATDKKSPPIEITSCKVFPSDFDANVGDQVIWHNNDGDKRTVKFDGDVPDLFGEKHHPPSPIEVRPGADSKPVTVTYKSSKPGKHKYHYHVECNKHKDGPHSIIVNQ